MLQLSRLSRSHLPKAQLTSLFGTVLRLLLTRVLAKVRAQHSQPVGLAGSSWPCPLMPLSWALFLLWNRSFPESILGEFTA